MSPRDPRPGTRRRKVARGLRDEARRSLNRLDVHRTVPIGKARALTRIGEEHRSTIDFAGLWPAVEALYRTGLHPAIGLTIRHKGALVLNRTIGHVEAAPGRSVGEIATPETLFNLFSASKLLTAVVVHALIEDGQLSLDDYAVTYLPEFARHGKESIQIRHLLNHTAGIPDMPRGFDLDRAIQTHEIPLEALAGIVPLSAPGDKVAYHPMTSWLLLNLITDRITGVDLRTLSRRRILDPLDFRRMTYGVGTHEMGLVAKHAATGVPVPQLMRGIFERTVGLPLDKAIALTNGEAMLTSILPSANVISTGREVTRFMQMLLRGGTLNGTRVLSEATVAAATTEATPVRFDGTFGFPMRYSHGMMMGGNKFSLFGLNTRGAFGHLGFTNVVVYGDPSRDLAVSFMNTGKPFLAPGMVRWYWILQRIAMLVPRN